MKNQQVNVDYWAMIKAMFIYGVLTALCWLMLRLFNTVFMLPRRLRAQQANIQNTLEDLQIHGRPGFTCLDQTGGLILTDAEVKSPKSSAMCKRMMDVEEARQRRFPDLNITEEDLKNAEKELEDFTKENDEENNRPKDTEQGKQESKKTI